MNASESLARNVIADRFEVQAEVGRGGAGILYRARDRASGALVALKVIACEAGVAPADEERLVLEGEILSGLAHPNIVRVVDSGRLPETGAPYMAMEWLAGEDLAAWAQRGLIEIGDALDIVQQVADALDAAHAAGVLHRDIKPANIFLEPADSSGPLPKSSTPAGATDEPMATPKIRLYRRRFRVKLVDFGVALNRDLLLAGRDEVVGTPAYMPPEQARGERHLGPSSDIYSLGATLFELVAGRPPHVAPSAIATLARLVTTPAPRLSDVRSNVPVALTDLVECMLALSPEERPQSAREVSEQLAEILLRLEREPVVDDSQTSSLRLGSSVTRLITSIVALGFRDPSSRDRLLADFALEGGEAVPLRHDSLVAHLGVRLTLGNEAHVAIDLGHKLAEAGAQVGIATGRARVQSKRADSVRPVGEVVDRAAALAREATLGSVLADGATSELAREAYEFRSRSDGSAWVGPRLRRLQAAGATPFVGREPELKRVLSSVERALRDSTAILTTMTGPAGIGKTRLRREALARLQGHEPCPTIVVQRSTAYGDRGALGAASDVLRSLTGLSKGVTLSEAEEAIAKRLGAGTSSDLGEESRQVLAHFLSDEALGAMGARDRLWLAMTDAVLAVLHETPVAIVLEDAQWADRESIGFFDHLLGRASDRPFVLLAVMRPEFWPAHPNVFSGRDHTRIWLRPISRRSTLVLARAVLGETADEDLAAQIADQAAGVPLFAEELARVAARGADPRHAATVEAAIQVSLDSLDEMSRDAIGRLSVFGLACWDKGLEALGFEKPATTLEELEAAEMLVVQERSRFQGAREWMFKHALVREVAYKALGEIERRELHAFAARFLDSMGEDSAVVARHFELAELDEEAAHHYARAARRALATNALQDALQMAEKALAFAASREEAFERAGCLDEAYARLHPNAGERESAVRALEESVYDEASEVRAQGARARYDDARGQGDQISERLAMARDGAARLQLFDEEARSSAALAVRLAFAGRFAEAEAEALRLLQLAEHDSAKAAAVDGWQTLAITHQTQGALTAALEARRSAVRAARAAGLREREAWLTTNLGFALTTIGARQEARSLSEAGLSLAAKIGSAGATRHAQMVMLGWAATFGNDKSLDSVLGEARAEADRAASASWIPPDRENLGMLYYRGCELFTFGGEAGLDRARALLGMSARAYRNTDNRDILPVALGMWAHAELAAGEAERALGLAKEATDLLDKGAPSLLNESPVYLALHEAELALGRSREAKLAVERAIAPLLRRLRGLVGTPYAQLFLTELTYNSDLVTIADGYGCLPDAVHEILERTPG